MENAKLKQKTFTTDMRTATALRNVTIKTTQKKTEFDLNRKNAMPSHRSHNDLLHPNKEKASKNMYA